MQHFQTVFHSITTTAAVLPRRPHDSLPPICAFDTHIKQNPSQHHRILQLVKEDLSRPAPYPPTHMHRVWLVGEENQSSVRIIP
jgi:hypothetical protein